MTSPPEDKYRIWDAYWRDSRLHSTGPDASPEIEAALDTHWVQVAAALPESARVLDLACGNGAVGLTMARFAHETGKSFKISGIDTAMIDPARFVTRHSMLLSTIDFRPQTRMEELPFEANTFDAVCSQYGMEYGDLSKTAWEISRVLKSYGIVSVLALPAASTVLESANKKLKQSQHILTQTKLFDVALAVAQALYHVESSGEGRDTKQYLERFNGEVERAMMRFANSDSDTVVAVIIALQNVFTQRKSMTIEQQLDAINTLRKRLTDLVARTEVTARAALGDAALNGLKRRLTEAGIVVSEAKPISVGTHGTIAWRIGGRKS